jgi:hypothetical protein
VNASISVTTLMPHARDGSVNRGILSEVASISATLFGFRSKGPETTKGAAFLSAFR